MQDIIYMTEKEILSTKFTVIMKVRYSSDMFVPIGYNEILLEGHYKAKFDELNILHRDGYCDLQMHCASFGWLRYKYVKSEYSEFYGESDIFTEQQFIDAVQKFLPIRVINGRHKKYHYIIHSDYTFTVYNSEKVRDKLISQATRDIFDGTEDELKTFIKDLKKLDKKGK